MAVTYTALDDAGQRVVYRDGKRWCWSLSVVFPLLPFLGIAVHALTGNALALGIPLLVSYGLMPLLDALIGEDLKHPPEAEIGRAHV